ncbi:ABC transporter permease [Candidatus Micrarchaeota archaeon]|nr:ABC transporter permease [Candidatus Micrarchaeota archaeon]
MMDLIDAFAYSVRSLRTSSLRSLLTIIGVVIGVVSLVVITSVSEGVQRDIMIQMEAFGPNMIIVVPISLDEGSVSSFSGAATAATGKLYERDAEAIAGIPGVNSVGRANYGRTSLVFRDKEVVAPIYAVDREYYDQYSDYFKIGEGRIFNNGEHHVVVLGNDAANKMFGKRKVDAGNMLKINGIDYRVIGVLERIGTSLSEQDDNSIFVPYDDGNELFGSQMAKNEVFMLSIKADEGADVQEIKDAIETKLIAYHKVTPDEMDFSVITSDYIQETVGTVLTMLTAFLLAITLIASVVGALGVANTMFMAVLERTREIGVLKAVGATEHDITTLFIIESAIIGIIGGILGLLIAVAILQVAGLFAVPFWLRLRIIALAFVFSSMIGIIAGFIPARQAARLDPVEALRG